MDLLKQTFQWDKSPRDIEGKQHQLHTITVPFHFPFQCSNPYSSPLIRDVFGRMQSMTSNPAHCCKLVCYWLASSLVSRPIRKIGEKGLVSIVCACCVKLTWKNVSNYGQYHVVKNYDVGMSAFVSRYVWQCIHVQRHDSRRYHGIIWNFRNVRKLSACANSGYQALFSDFSNRPGYEAIYLASSVD